MEGIIKRDIFTSWGALYKNTVVKVESINENRATVRDLVGRIFYIDKHDIKVEIPNVAKTK